MAKTKRFLGMWILVAGLAACDTDAAPESVKHHGVGGGSVGTPGGLGVNGGDGPELESIRAIVASADTYLRKGAPNTREGYELFFRLKESGDNRGLVRFDTGRIAEAVDGELVSALLEVTIVGNGDNWGRAGAPWTCTA